MSKKLPIIVFVSGTGTNLKAIIDNCVNAEVVGIVSNNKDAPSVAIPDDIPIYRPHVDSNWNESIEKSVFDWMMGFERRPQMLVLAGFMSILSKDFLEMLNIPVLNIHPSLLPKHKGLNTHQRSYATGDDYHGCTVHIVTPELDSGPILAQRRFYAKPLIATEREDVCKHMEHFLYPTVIDTFAATYHYLEEFL